MPRMRTAQGVYNIIREQDPGTEITLHYIRGLIASGKVPYVAAGRKKMVDADAVIKFIAAGENPAPQQVERTPIRKVTD